MLHRFYLHIDFSRVFCDSNCRPIEGIEYGEDGKITAIRAPDPDDENNTVKAVKCKMVISDPSYFPDKVKISLEHILFIVISLQF